MTIKRILKLSVFTAVALIIHTVEALVPLPVPVPGMKLGLANAVTLFILFEKPRTQEHSRDIDALIVLICRVVLGAFITGRLIMLAYSFTGGLFAFAAMFIMKRFVTDTQIWVCGATGAVFHNIGQISAAMIIMGSPGMLIYLPVLIITGIITGTITGILAGLTVGRLKI